MNRELSKVIMNRSRKKQQIFEVDSRENYLAIKRLKINVTI